MAPVVIFVDVDDTFVRSFGTKRIAMPNVIAHIRQLHADGAQLYCWSSGGGEYARASAAEFGIAECFLAFLPKPHVMLDDKWRQVHAVHPNECTALTLEDYRAKRAS